MLKNYSRQAGVTFIEIMIVIVIMAALAAMTGPALFNQFGKAKVNQARTEMNDFLGPLLNYRLDNNVYPSSEQGLSALLNKPELGVLPDNWNGPYISGFETPKDPWNNDYVYVSDGQSFELKSFGQDGLEGGSGNDQDIECTPQGCRK